MGPKTYSEEVATPFLVQLHRKRCYDRDSARRVDTRMCPTTLPPVTRRLLSIDLRIYRGRSIAPDRLD